MHVRIGYHALATDYHAQEAILMYPTTPTTYKLPFDTTVRVSSKSRYVLVRENKEGKPSIVRRSDTLATLEKLYDPATDYIVDQARGFVTYHFNGRQEHFDGIDGKHLYGPGPFVVARTGKQAI
jgi:hypothetical protein